MNGKITEVKQSAIRLILRWVTIWYPNILSFFSLAITDKNIRQICQILQINMSFGKTQMALSFTMDKSQIYLGKKIDSGIDPNSTPCTVIYNVHRSRHSKLFYKGFGFVYLLVICEHVANHNH